ncbi:partial HTH-type transcriptional regulator MalT, partial [Gammaproteobacteria bacterium]
MNRSSTTRQTEKQGLLSTKLIPPRLPSSLVPRRALLARLDAGLDRKVTLISAPPGSGKTTLVAAWLTAQQGVQFGWVSLDAGD